MNNNDDYSIILKGKTNEGAISECESVSREVQDLLVQADATEL